MKKLYNINNTKYKRVSRWIRIDTAVITSNHRLSDYADFYDDVEGKYGILYYFRYHNKWYALSQFLSVKNFDLFDEHGEKVFICGYDATSSYYPLLCEINESGDYIRLYQQVH